MRIKRSLNIPKTEHQRNYHREPEDAIYQKAQHQRLRHNDLRIPYLLGHLGDVSSLVVYILEATYMYNTIRFYFWSVLTSQYFLEDFIINERVDRGRKADKE